MTKLDPQHATRAAGSHVARHHVIGTIPRGLQAIRREDKPSASVV
jgi:hypothetical protein